MYFTQCSFTEMKSTFIKLQNQLSRKDIGQELLIERYCYNILFVVNSSV